MSEARLDGAVVITGAAGGMGAACARAMAASASTLVLTDLDASSLEAVADELAAAGRNIETHAGNLTAPATTGRLSAAVEAAGGLDALVLTAALSPTMADAATIYRVNLAATCQLIDTLRPLANEGCAAVLVASQAGTLCNGAVTPEIAAILDDPLASDFFERLIGAAGEAFAGSSGGAYSLAKNGVQRLAVSRAPAWGERAARIVSLSPGIIDTGMGQQEFAAQPVMKTMVERTPAGARMGRPEEIAAVIAFLCSPDASFVTGVDWLVDGGSTNQMLRGDA